MVFIVQPAFIFGGNENYSPPNPTGLIFAVVSIFTVVIIVSGFHSSLILLYTMLYFKECSPHQYSRTSRVATGKRELHLWDNYDCCVNHSVGHSRLQTTSVFVSGSIRNCGCRFGHIDQHCVRFLSWSKPAGFHSVALGWHWTSLPVTSPNNVLWQSAKIVQPHRSLHSISFFRFLGPQELFDERSRCQEETGRRRGHSIELYDAIFVPVTIFSPPPPRPSFILRSPRPCAGATTGVLW